MRVLVIADGSLSQDMPSTYITRSAEIMKAEGAILGIAGLVCAVAFSSAAEISAQLDSEYFILFIVCNSSA